MSDRYSDLPMERLRKFGWSDEDAEMLEFGPGPIINRGGPGSGHFGHKGRPGERGGSLPGEGGDEKRYLSEARGGTAPWRGRSQKWSEADMPPRYKQDIESLAILSRQVANAIEGASFSDSVKWRAENSLLSPPRSTLVSLSAKVAERVESWANLSNVSFGNPHDRITLYRLSLAAAEHDYERLKDLGYADKLTPEQRDFIEGGIRDMRDRLAEYPPTGMPSEFDAIRPNAQVQSYRALFPDDSFESSLLDIAATKWTGVSNLGTIGNMEADHDITPEMADAMRAEWVRRLEWPANQGDANYMGIPAKSPEHALALAVEGDRNPWVPGDAGRYIELNAEAFNDGWQHSTATPAAILMSEEAAKLWGGTAVPRQKYDPRADAFSVPEGSVGAPLSPEKASVPGGGKYWLTSQENIEAYYANEKVRSAASEMLQEISTDTQEWFRAAGFGPDDTIRLYRGIRGDDGRGNDTTASWNPNGVVDGVTDVEMYSLSSWSLSPPTAAGFSNIEQKTGYVVAADIPVKQIIATPTTGFPCQSEHEFIVSGGKVRGAVLSGRALIDRLKEEPDTANVMLYQIIAPFADELLPEKAALPVVYPDEDNWLWISRLVKERDGITPDELDARRNLGMVERVGTASSGHHGHKGRPGQRGGSLPGDKQEGKEQEKPKVKGATRRAPRARRGAGTRFFGTAPDEWHTGLDVAATGKAITRFFDEQVPLPTQSELRARLQAVGEAKTPEELSDAIRDLERMMMESAQPGTATRLRYMNDPEVKKAWEAVENYRKWVFFNQAEALRESYGGYHPAEHNEWAFRNAANEEQAREFQYTVGSAMLDIADLSGFRLSGLTLRDHIPQAWVDEMVKRGKDPTGLLGGFDPRAGELVLPPDPNGPRWSYENTVLHELTHVVDDAAASVEGYSRWGDGVYASTVTPVPTPYAETIVSYGKGIYERRSDVHGEFVADAVAGIFQNMTTGPRTGLPISAENGVRPALTEWLRVIRSGELDGMPEDRAREIAARGHEKWEVTRAMTTDDGTRIFIRTLNGRGGYEVLFKPDGPFITPEVTERGGPGSGHFGHKGRPGERGGSQPGEGGGKEGAESKYGIRHRRSAVIESDDGYWQVIRDEKGMVHHLNGSLRAEGQPGDKVEVQYISTPTMGLWYARKAGADKRYLVEEDQKQYLSYKGENKTSPRVVEMSSGLYAKAQAAEPRLSEVVKTAAEASGGQTFGWEWRIKSPESIADKIIRDAVEKDIAPSEAAEGMNDLNRYTLLFPPDTFVTQANQAMASLEAAGFEQYDSKAKNYFAPGDDYDGYNTVYWDPKTGEKFELQFHTPDSVRIKEEAHLIYRDWRELPTNDPERVPLYNKMLGLWGDYERPHNYEQLPGRLMTAGGG